MCKFRFEFECRKLNGVVWFVGKYERRERLVLNLREKGRELGSKGKF